jgi:hypothetical protein
MASNLSTIGFVFDDETGFRNAMLACAGATQLQLGCPAGNYGIWRSRSGAEVWFHLGRSPSGEVEIFGLTPFFEGKSDVPLYLTKAVTRAGDNAFEGAFHGAVHPDAENPAGAYPIVFDAVDFAARSSAELPALRHVRLAAFARELAAHADEAAYFAAQSDDGQPHLAAQAFIPIGLFAADQEANEQANPAASVPASTAIFTGKVIEHSRLINEASGRAFDWLLVETLEATIDVIADPDIVKGEIVEGGTIEASALLFGRLLD